MHNNGNTCTCTQIKETVWDTEPTKGQSKCYHHFNRSITKTNISVHIIGNKKGKHFFGNPRKSLKKPKKTKGEHKVNFEQYHKCTSPTKLSDNAINRLVGSKFSKLLVEQWMPLKHTHIATILYNCKVYIYKYMYHEKLSHINYENVKACLSNILIVDELRTNVQQKDSLQI